MLKKTDEERLKVDYARERIRNYLDDHSIKRADFARAISRSPRYVSEFMSEHRDLGPAALHQAAKVMGITYEKLVSPLTAADYVGIQPYAEADS